MPTYLISFVPSFRLFFFAILLCQIHQTVAGHRAWRVCLFCFVLFCLFCFVLFVLFVCLTLLALGKILLEPPILFFFYENRTSQHYLNRCKIPILLNKIPRKRGVHVCITTWMVLTKIGNNLCMSKVKCDFRLSNTTMTRIF